jgi:hypothetical protein
MLYPKLCALCLGIAMMMGGAALAQQPPPFAQRGMPGSGQKVLEPLAGDWDVTMTLFAAMGSPQKPFVAKLSCHREWIAQGRFLRDVTEGPNYFRQGTLGYSNMDKRYEWTTQDAINANMMIYLGKPGSGPGLPITMAGSFTDQGILGEADVGKRVAQRTVITLHDRDHHEIDIYFTPSGARERLVDRKVYVRKGT